MSELKHVNSTIAINIGVPLLGLAAVLLAYGVLHDRQYISIGKAVDCENRLSYDYFTFCNPLRDGEACTLESQSRMQKWYSEIDYACAQFEPKKPFVFPIHREPEPLELAEAR